MTTVARIWLVSYTLNRSAPTSDARTGLHQGRRHSAALMEHHSARLAVSRRTAPQTAEITGGLVVRGDLCAVRCHPDDRRIARERVDI